MNPSELMSDVWARWQGHVINDAFPLGRCLGSSDHSGVFLTEGAAPGPAQLAVKLVPADRALSESPLPGWQRARGIVHPNLLTLFQCGGCQLDGLPCLYVVMEYADQTLAQLLLRRALSEEEAREMLRPVLSALAFLHHQDLVHGQLKPANILVVGDQLKLASDTIRRVGDGRLGGQAPSIYDPPEARRGRSSTAGDIWALGVCLFEALTRRPPPPLRERGEAVALPADFPAAFRDIVVRCLNPNPQSRPGVAELAAWAGGQAAGPAPAATVTPEATVEPAPTVRPESTTSLPAPRRVTPPAATVRAPKSAPKGTRFANPRVMLAAALGAVVIIALGWTTVRMMGSHPAPPPSPALDNPVPASANAAAPVAAALEHVPAAMPAKANRGDVTSSPSALHEVIPDVPQSARRTISGHINVWVRVIVDQNGLVVGATADLAGPSRYFERLAVEAARKWTFAAINTASRRPLQIRFDFSRDGATGRAVALH